MTLNKSSESYILKKVLEGLKKYQYSGTVIWYLRIQSSVVNVGNMYITLGKVGTPDIITIIRRKDENLAVLFLEVKRHGETKLRYEQREFFKGMEKEKHIYCKLINDPNNLWGIIEGIKNEK